MHFKIIQLGIIHLNVCLEIDQKLLKGIWSKAEWIRELTDPKRLCIGAINLETKKLLGLCTAWVVLDELQITFLAVHPTHQRKGLGKSLLSEITNFSKSIETNRIHLEVKDSNKTARAFYKSMGFEISGRRPNLYKDGSDGLTLIKKIEKQTFKELT